MEYLFADLNVKQVNKWRKKWPASVSTHTARSATIIIISCRCRKHDQPKKL